MKKRVLFITILFVSVFLPFSHAAGSCLDGKIGTSYATDAEKFGLQLNFAFFNELDPYFVIGVEPGIYWLKWDRKVDTKKQGLITADVKSDTNIYMIPVLADAQIRLPNLKEKINFLPHLTIGLGYSIMIYDSNQPEYVDYSTGTPVTKRAEEKTKLYSGFTWQMLAGGTFKPGQESKVEFLFELGYRGAKLKKGSLEVDMSGFIINFGVRYPFGGPSAEQSAYGAI